MGEGVKCKQQVVVTSCMHTYLRAVTTNAKSVQSVNVVSDCDLPLSAIVLISQTHTRSEVNEVYFRRSNDKNTGSDHIHA